MLVNSERFDSIGVDGLTWSNKQTNHQVKINQSRAVVDIDDNGRAHEEV